MCVTISSYNQELLLMVWHFTDYKHDADVLSLRMVGKAPLSGLGSGLFARNVKFIQPHSHQDATVSPASESLSGLRSLSETWLRNLPASSRLLAYPTQNVPPHSTNPL